MKVLSNCIFESNSINRSSTQETNCKLGADFVGHKLKNTNIAKI